MCLQKSAVAPWDSWNWAGDQIIPAPIIRASRNIPGSKKRYNIDIREFLTTINNAVVHERLDQLIHELPTDQQALFRSHSRGSFDLRADRVVQFISRLKYKPKANLDDRCPDAWLFPDETLSQGGGDCEDLALLLAAFLIAAGISSYCVRVALGSLHMTLADGMVQKHDHCWVMYQNEDGIWEILEPLHVVASPGTKAKAVKKSPNLQETEYVPHYVFNVDHLWLIDSKNKTDGGEFHAYCKDRKFWGRFDPTFAASVHADIFDSALLDLSLPGGAISAMKRKSLWLDVNIAAYNPTDHFDSGYIPEGWAKVNSNLANFKNNPTDWGSFGAAGHGIADFYAHSSYGHFAAIQPDGSILPYSPAAPISTPSYASPSFDLTSGRFSMNSNLWHGSPQQAADVWQGKLISGRYAQRYDPKAGFWEGITSIPRSLSSAPGFADRGSLPHHNEIAVDDVTRGSDHILYTDARTGPNDRRSYKNQFDWRKNAAIEHVRMAYQSSVGP